MTQPADQLRRNLLASLPAFLLAPAVLAQQGGLVSPQTAHVPSSVKREIPILPFALAGAWSDDFGGRSILKMTLALSGSITFAGQATVYQDDELRLLKLQIGAAMECVETLARSSSCGFQSLYPKQAEPWFVKLSVAVSAQGKAPSDRGIMACSGIWSRPNASGAFDPAWNDTKVVEHISAMMIEFGVSVKLMVDANSRQCADALQVIAKASPALAQKIGPASNWGAGTSIVLVGTASQDSTQGLISAGRTLQRGPLQAFAEGVNCNSFVLPPKMLEAAAVTSKEAAMAVRTLVKLFDEEASEPMGVSRIGKLLVPAFNSMPVCLPMITFA
ncbi:MAG: hypothetical protein EXS12_04635 [Phycisphaerales bacterium]|nr:hypothetical protein [Phycisphaerales bacterium]